MVLSDLVASIDVRREHATERCRHCQLWRTCLEKSDHWHYRLLRTRSKRPRRSRGAKKRDEVAPLHQIANPGGPLRAIEHIELAGVRQRV
jgi:hypothetical protein